MYNDLYAGRRPPSLEEQCLAQLKFFETHVSLRNVEQLSQITLFKNQLRITPTLAGDDFIHIVGTVAQEETHIYVQQGAAHKNVLTVTVHTVDRNHDVQFRFLTNNAKDASHFVVHFLDKDAATFSHLPAERTPHPVRFF